MTAQSFDHERLDVYRLSIDDAAMKAMLTRMAMKFDGVAESNTEYGVESAEIDCDYRVAEHEHETQNQRNARTMPST